MKKTFTVFLLCLQLTAFGQAVFKPFEVESQPEPQGGLPLLEKFIEVNRRMPYAAEVAGVKGTVYVSGIVGTDGRITGVQVVRSLHPACDREAVRVLGLFNAWKPGQKGGKAVPVEFSYGIKFAPTRSGCAPGAITTYYSADGKPVAEEAGAQYRLVLPVDSLGYPNAAPALARRKGEAWKDMDNRFARREKLETRYNYTNPNLPDSLRVRRISLLSVRNRLQGTQYVFYPSGALFATESYEDGQAVGTWLYYYPNGLVCQADEQLQGGGVREWHWYPNGQLKQVGLRPERKDYELLNQWDAQGKQTVQNGSGPAKIVSRLGEMEWVTETGALINRQRHGTWTGRRADGQLYYREEWDNGKFLRGTSYGLQGDAITYDKPKIDAEFEGGLPGLGEFLTGNMSYPRDAARSNVEGKVAVSFVVCTDGSLCDYQVIQSVHPSLDEEAIRVVKEMNGKWKGGILRGRPVRVKYNLPINFVLQ